MEETTELIRITMPKSMASKFRDRSKYYFHNCFWLQIEHDRLIADVFMKKADDEVLDAIQTIRKELIELVKEMYNK